MTEPHSETLLKEKTKTQPRLESTVRLSAENLGPIPSTLTVPHNPNLTSRGTPDTQHSIDTQADKTPIQTKLKGEKKKSL